MSDRDFALDALYTCSLIALHVSRLSEELILWSSGEFRFIEIADRFSTGSSIMPQKKNPDVAELVRGKTARVNGHLVALLILMKSQPLAYNRDNQEDKEPLFDTIDTVRDSLRAFADMVTLVIAQPVRVPDGEIDHGNRPCGSSDTTPRSASPRASFGSACQAATTRKPPMRHLLRRAAHRGGPAAGADRGGGGRVARVARKRVGFASGGPLCETIRFSAGNRSTHGEEDAHAVGLGGGVAADRRGDPRRGDAARPGGGARPARPRAPRS